MLPGSLYSATKWAVGAIGEGLRSELRQPHQNTGIRVTLIEPGMTDTEFFDQRPQNALRDDDIRERSSTRSRSPTRGRQRDPDPPGEPVGLTADHTARAPITSCHQARSVSWSAPRMHLSACSRTCLALPMISNAPVAA